MSFSIGYVQLHSFAINIKKLSDNNKTTLLPDLSSYWITTLHEILYYCGSEHGDYSLLGRDMV